MASASDDRTRRERPAPAPLATGERPRKAFCYVAGNSALDNGAGDDALSGCDTEISALREAGCYADFTFSSLGSPAQPRTTNSIYSATEDGRPKSYDTGVPVAVGRPPSGDLMIFQGPTAVDWRHGRIDQPLRAPPLVEREARLAGAELRVTGILEAEAQPDHVAVEADRRGQVGDVEDQVADAVHRSEANGRSHEARLRRRGRPGRRG